MNEDEQLEASWARHVAACKRAGTRPRRPRADQAPPGVKPFGRRPPAARVPWAYEEDRARDVRLFARDGRRRIAYFGTLEVAHAASACLTLSGPEVSEEITRTILRTLLRPMGISWCTIRDRRGALVRVERIPPCF